MQAGGLLPQEEDQAAFVDDQHQWAAIVDRKVFELVEVAAEAPTVTSPTVVMSKSIPAWPCRRTVR